MLIGERSERRETTSITCVLILLVAGWAPFLFRLQWYDHGVFYFICRTETTVHKVFIVLNTIYAQLRPPRECKAMSRIARRRIESTKRWYGFTTTNAAEEGGADCDSKVPPQYTLVSNRNGVSEDKRDILLVSNCYTLHMSSFLILYVTSNINYKFTAVPEEPVTMSKIPSEALLPLLQHYVGYWNSIHMLCGCEQAHFIISAILIPVIVLHFISRVRHHLLRVHCNIRFHIPSNFLCLSRVYFKWRRNDRKWRWCKIVRGLLSAELADIWDCGVREHIPRYWVKYLSCSHRLPGCGIYCVI